MSTAEVVASKAKYHPTKEQTPPPYIIEINSEAEVKKPGIKKHN